MKSHNKAGLAVILLAGLLVTMTAPSALAQDDLVAAADTEVPTDVENVVATAGNGQVKLTWNVATDNELVKGYRVYYGTTPVVSDGDAYAMGPIDVGNKITYTVTGLANATKYYFAVTAYDDAGNESENYSPEVSATPAHAAADTEAPTVVSAEAAN
ncbi:MAG TPA: fibronectin type III domain-containing protein, partial [Candidatus Gracilibacteria bacterium]|nr:fibronectin type III domain-containing protein [Candidatus Gracilibacteria bacterium]